MASLLPLFARAGTTGVSHYTRIHCLHQHFETPSMEILSTFYKFTPEHFTLPGVVVGGSAL